MDGGGLASSVRGWGGGRRVRAFQELPVVYAALAAYTTLSAFLMAARGRPPGPTHLLLAAAVVAAAAVPARRAVWELLPLAVLPAMFQDLAAVAPALAGAVHPALSISPERTLLGGEVAASWLQGHAAGLPGVGLLNGTLSVEYLLSDVGPVAVGAWLWLRHREWFRIFLTADVLAHAAGFLVYIVFPEMPPWLASQHGLVPHVERIVVDVLGRLLGGAGSAYAGSDPVPNAAMPSIHVAIPTFLALLVGAARGWRSSASLLAAGYAVSIFAGVVYLGEHWVADALGGALLGWGCFEAALAAERRLEGSRRGRDPSDVGVRPAGSPAAG